MSGKFVLVILLLACVFGCFVFYTATVPQKTTDTIEMLQPCGWPWCASYDSHYAQNVNEPNSRANLNNAVAVKEKSEAELLQAKADRLRVEQFEEQSKIAITSALLTAFFLISMFGLIVLALFKNRF
jgi:hypothetical protein